jgi:hypothetical protein
MADEMREGEFVRSMFFSSDADFAASKAADGQQPVRRKRKRRDPGIEALGKFIAVLERENPSSRQAVIFYLADRYLGIKMSRYR